MVERLHKILLNKEAFYIFSKLPLEVDDLVFTITNGDSLFNGTVSSSEIQDMAKNADMSSETFYKLIKESFGYKDTTASFNFTYQITNEDACLPYKFIIKQQLEDGMLFQLGTFVLHKENSCCKIIEMFDSLQSQLTLLQEEAANFKSLTKSLEADKKDMCKRLEEYTVIKNNLEQDLYAKFSLVLNEKKARIRDLKRQLESRDSKSPARKTHEASNDDLSETDEEVDTDDEKGHVLKKRSESEPSSVLSVADIILDEQIADDDDKPRKNRKRMRGSKPKTPLPRTASLPRPAQRQNSKDSSKGAMKKRKSKEITEDELLAEL